MRLATAAVVGCLLAGLVEAMGIGGVAAVAAVGLWGLATPAVFAALVALELAWRSPPLVAARDPQRRSAALAVALLAGGAVLAVRLMTGSAAAFAVDAVRDPALIAPLTAAMGAAVALAGLALGTVLFGPLRRLLDRLAHPLTTALALLGGLALAALALLPPIFAVAKDVPARPRLLLLALGIALLAARLLPRRRVVFAGVLVTGLGLTLVAAWMVRERPAVEAALVDAYGISGPLAGLIVPPDEATLEPDDAPMAEAIDETAADAGHTPAADHVDEGPPVARGPLPAALQRRWNILVITIDTVRADHLSLHGYPRATSPHLDALGARSAVFERAYTPVNATRWFPQSMFTGRMIGDVDLAHAGDYVWLQPNNGQIFERLRAAGWHTEAHNADQLRRGMWFGLDAGFDRYVGYPSLGLKDVSSAALVDGFEEALDGAPSARPWAMWVHLLEPHEPYREQPGFDFGDAPVDRYDGEIAAADALVGRMIEALESRRLTDSTIVVVTSDHGEEFGEHGRKYHGKQLYEESVRVPLVIHVPGLAPRRLQAPVSVIDVAPTIAHLTGLPPGRSPGLDGHHTRSLAPVMNGAPEDMARAVFVDCIRGVDRFGARKMAMIRGTEKLIADMNGVEGRGARYYDLATDPAEKDNLRYSAPARYAEAAALFTAELKRRRRNHRARLLARHVSTFAPALPGEPQPIREGLTLLGAHLEAAPWIDRRMPLLRTYFRVDGPQPDLVLRHDYLDESGRQLKRKQYRPLLGLYRSRDWQPGQVVEDLRMVRFRPTPVRYTQVMLTVLERDRVVFGPHRLAKAVPDVRTGPAVEPAGPHDGRAAAEPPADTPPAPAGAARGPE